MPDTSANRLNSWLLGIVASVGVVGIVGGIKLNGTVGVLGANVGFLGTTIERDRTALMLMLTDQQGRIQKLENQVEDIRLKDAKRDGRSEVPKATSATDAALWDAWGR